jgi:transposase
MEIKNKTYSVDFKIKAVELSKQRGSVVEIANELGVLAKNLSRWRQEYDAGKFDLKSKTKIKTKDELEMIALKKGLRDKEIECEILKKALRIFTLSGK